MASETVRLHAESSYGHSGQYIARITGRAERVQFARAWCGSKYGKRNECTSLETDETGLYEICDVTKRGKEKTFKLILPWKDALVCLTSDMEDALKIAKRLDNGERLEDFVVAELGDPLFSSSMYMCCAICETEIGIPDRPKCPEHSDAQNSYKSRKIPRLSDDGRPIHEIVYTIRSAAEVKKADTAATLDSAVEAIVTALAALPAPLQKKALAAAKTRLFPPAEKPESETPI